MKKSWIFSRNHVLPLFLAALALIVTGCPHNDYTVELKPEGNVIRRTLTFYQADGASNGVPNYQTFSPQELALITAFYPSNNLTNDGERQIISGEFPNAMPGGCRWRGCLYQLDHQPGIGGILCGAV